MAQKDFVFVFVKDKTFESPSPWLLEYVRFKHPTETKHKVVCVADAIKFMLKELKEDDFIGNINIYSHSNEIGYVWGRLESNEEYKGISEIRIKAFKNKSPLAKRLLKYGNTKTFVKVNGCNFGKSLQALINWQDLLAGSEGKGVAPKLFQHYGLSTLTLKATWGKKQSVFYEHEIKHMNDIIEYSKRSVVEAKKRKMKLQPSAEETLRDNAIKDVDKWLHENYLLLRRGNQLPPGNNNLSVENILTFMQESLNEFKGIPVTYLYSMLRSEINQGNVRAIMKKHGAIFPEDRQWEYYHQAI